MPSPDRDPDVRNDGRTRKKDRRPQLIYPTTKPTELFNRRSRNDLSPGRMAFRRALPSLVFRMTAQDMAKKFHIPLEQVASDLLFYQGEGRLPRRNETLSTKLEDLPYEKALERARQFEDVIRTAIEADPDISLTDLITVLESKVDWTNHIYPSAARAVSNRIRKESNPRPSRSKKR